MFKIIICIILSLTAAIPLSGKQFEKNIPPQWVENHAGIYPSAMFLAAVESGITRKEAETNAVEAIAAIFDRTIVSETQTELNYSTSEKAGKIDITKTKNIDKKTNISTNIDNLIGVEIKEVWQSPDGKYFALAVLNKRNAALIYSEKITTNNTTVEELLQTADSRKNTFDEYVFYNCAYEIATENDRFLSILAVLSPAQKKLLEEKTVKPHQLKIKCVNSAKNLPIMVTAEGDKNGKIQSTFLNVLSEEGFSTAKESRYSLAIHLALSVSTLPNKKIETHYTLEAELKDTNEILLSYSTTGKVIHIDENRAEAKTFTVLEKKIKSEFSSAFKKYLRRLI